MEKAVILCDGYFGQSTGKTANGLVRHSKRYQIAGVIDHTKAGRDAGEVLDGKANGIPIVANLKEAVEKCGPETLIIGVATFGGYIPREFRPIIREAIENRLNIVAGLHEYLNDDPYDEGWMVQVELTSPDELGKLMSADEYQTFLKEQETH